MNRDDFLLMTDDELLRHCDISACRGSGNGGQKRNKTSNAIRVKHIESGLSATDCSERSASRNRSCALRKLRLELAWNLRMEPSESGVAVWPPPSEHNDGFPLWCARMLDLLASFSYEATGTAERLEISVSKLTRTLHGVPELFRRWNEERVRAGKSVLHG